MRKLNFQSLKGRFNIPGEVRFAVNWRNDNMSSYIHFAQPRNFETLEFFQLSVSLRFDTYLVKEQISMRYKCTLSFARSSNFSITSNNDNARYKHCNVEAFFITNIPNHFDVDNDNHFEDKTDMNNWDHVWTRFDKERNSHKKWEVARETSNYLPWAVVRWKLELAPHDVYLDLRY